MKAGDPHGAASLLCIIICLLAMMQATVGQSPNDKEQVSYFGGSVTVTNNGISLVPTFSLGDPAAIFEMNAGRKLSFEPQFRIALDGKPWAFIFWWRYKFLSDRRFQIRLGAHPAVLFASETVTSNGRTGDMLIARRYLAAEISPDYYLTKNISVGVYYLKAHGFQDDAMKNTDFITLNCKFNDIRLSKNLYIYFYPQFYYLRMDESDGIYFTSTQGLTIKNFPLSVQSIINQPIQSGIEGGQNFVWNISLIYNFGNQYTSMK